MIAGDIDEMVDQRSPDPAASRRRSGVHGLHLGVVFVELLQRCNSEKNPVEAEAEERDGGVEETIHVECMDILRRTLGVGELQVALQQCPNVRRAWVVNRDLVIRHNRTLCEPKVSGCTTSSRQMSARDRNARSAA
jgi:hypothetical protein